MCPTRIFNGRRRMPALLFQQMDILQVCGWLEAGNNCTLLRKKIRFEIFFTLLCAQNCKRSSNLMSFWFVLVVTGLKIEFENQNCQIQGNLFQFLPIFLECIVPSLKTGGNNCTDLQNFNLSLPSTSLEFCFPTIVCHASFFALMTSLNLHGFFLCSGILCVFLIFPGLFRLF